MVILSDSSIKEGITYSEAFSAKEEVIEETAKSVW